MSDSPRKARRGRSVKPAPLPGAPVPSLLDRVSDGIVVLDRDLRCEFINAAGAAIVGAPADTLLGVPLCAQLPGGIGQPVQQAMEHARTTQQPSVSEVYFAPWDRWLENRIYPSPDGLTLLCHDITDRKRAEDLLRESEDRFRDLVEHSEDLICTHDLEGRILSLNETPARILGYERDDLLHQPLPDLLAPESRDRFAHYLTAIRRHGKAAGTMVILTRDGERRIWSFRNTLRTEGVATPIVRGMAHDITARRRAEAALRESEEKFSTAFHSNPAMIVLATLDGRNVDFNQAYQSFLGLSRDQMLGKSVVDLHVISAEDRQRIVDRIDSGSPLDFEVSVPTRAGLSHLMMRADKVSLGGVPHRLMTILDVTEQKRAEAALRASTERLEFIARGTLTGVFDWDLATNAVRYSREWKQLLGYEDHEVADRFDEWERLTHPDDIAPVMARVRAFLAHPGGSFEAEFRMRHKSGGWRWILSRVTAFLGNDGMPARLLGLHVDITERKQDQERHRERERLLAALISNLPGVVFRVRNDPAYTVEFVSDRIAELTGYPAGDFRANRRNFGELMHPDDRDRVWSDIQRALGERRPYEVTYRFHDARGQVRWNWEKGAGVFAASGELQAVEGFVQDVSERKVAEQQLRDSEAMLRQILDTMFVYIALLTPQGELLEVNQAPLAAAGMTREEALGRRLYELNPWLSEPEAQARLVDAIRRAATGETVRFGATVRMAGDRRLTFDALMAPLLDREGRVVRLVASGVDVSERVEAQARLQEAYAALRALAAGRERARESERARLAREMHDELGQVLTGIKMDLSWLASRLPPGLDAVAQRAAAMSAMLDDAVAVGRRIAGELRPGVLDDLGLAAAVRWQAREFTRRADLTVQVDVDDDLVVEQERATAAYRILQEALTNVARHAGATTVSIRLAGEAGLLRLEVKDNGRGLAPEQARPAGSFGIQGMRERAEAWGGRLTVSPSPDGGTILAAHIPLGVAVDAP